MFWCQVMGTGYSTHCALFAAATPTLIREFTVLRPEVLFEDVRVILEGSDRH